MLKCSAYAVGLLVGFTGASWAQERSPLDVVEALYEAQEEAFTDGWAPLLMHKEQAEKFFFNDTAEILDGINMGYDPLYQGQDAEISNMSIELNTDFPKMSSTAVVDVEFHNFDRLVEMKFVLHRELADDNAWQVFDVEFDGGALSALVSLAHNHPGGFAD